VLAHGLAALAAAVGCTARPDEATSSALTGLATPGPTTSPGPTAAASPTTATATASATAVPPTPAPRLRSLIDQVGPLGPADALGVRLPAGFTARIVARSGQPVLPDGYLWHPWPDGGATFATADGGWIYVSNSELPVAGGVGALRFDADGQVVDAYRILDGTNINCAGGPTPWGTWLSCEEIDRGGVFECDPTGETEAIERPALGRFKHEAATIDPDHGIVYLSEDETDGRLYRFVADGSDADGRLWLDAGRLEVAVVDEEGAVQWVEVPDPLAEGDVATRHQVAEATVFDGGEGIWWFEGVVYLATKGDNRVWAYDTATQTLTVLYDRATAPDPDALFGVDNLTVSACGDVLVAEDGGLMRIVAVMPDGQLTPLMQIEGQEGSEITGPAFDPSGTRLYFSSQRAEGLLVGITYEITGPFHEPIGDDEDCDG